MKTDILPDSTPPEEIHNPEEDDCTQERDEECGPAEVTLINRAGAEHRGEEEATKEGSDDPDNDIEENALLRIRPHHETRKPSNETAGDEP